MDVKTLLFSPLGQWVLAGAAILVLWLVSRALVKLAAYAHAAAEKATTDHKSATQLMLFRAADVLSKCAADAVQYVEATMRPQILGAAQGGKLDAAQANELKDTAVKIALEQARVQFGQILQQLPGIIDTAAFTPTIEHLVEIGAQRLAGNSRLTGVASVPGPQTKTTDMQGQPIP